MSSVAFGVMDSETNDNWLWFMERLRDAIGTPEGLAICTDAGKGIDIAVQQCSGYAEHRECILHLVTNFKKRFHEKVFNDHLWPAAYAWTMELSMLTRNLQYISQRRGYFIRLLIQEPHLRMEWLKGRINICWR